MFGAITMNTEFIKELGYMVVAFSNLEKELQGLCGSQIKGTGKNYIANIITSEYSFKQLIKVTRSVLIKTEHIDKCPHNLFNRLNAIEDERNKIIHSYYGLDIHDGAIIRNKNKNRPHGHIIDMVKISFEDVSKLVNDMKKIERELQVIKHKVTKRVGKLPPLK